LGTALYPTLLCGSWHELDEAVQRLHAADKTIHASGVFQVFRGTNWITRMLAKLARLPPAGEAVDVRLVVTPHPEGEEWQRSFDGRPLVSMQYPSPGGLLCERMGMAETRFRLEVIEHALHYRAISAALCLGKMRIRLPRWFCPRVTACERAGDEKEQVIVNVEIIVPWLGRLIAYAGVLKILDEV